MRILIILADWSLKIVFYIHIMIQLLRKILISHLLTLKTKTIMKKNQITNQLEFLILRLTDMISEKKKIQRVLSYVFRQKAFLLNLLWLPFQLIILTSRKRNSK